MSTTQKTLLSVFCLFAIGIAFYLVHWVWFDSFQIRSQERGDTADQAVEAVRAVSVNGRQFQIPAQYTVHPTEESADFFTADYNCKITLASYPKEGRTPVELLDSFLGDDDHVTVRFEETRMEGDVLVYDTDVVETGRTSIVISSKEDVYTVAFVGSNRSDESCFIQYQHIQEE